MEFNRWYPSLSASSAYYTTSDCTGTPYLFPSEFNGDVFHTASIIAESQNQGDPLRLYVSTTNATTDITYQSHFHFGCVPNSGNVQGVHPAELVDGDLLSTLPPPYSLEFKE